MLAIAGCQQASTNAGDTYAATLAALKVGEQGVIFSREYSEMRLGNLGGAGRAVREAEKARGDGENGRE